MDMIEPNVTALCWFAVFASVAGVGFYVLTGAFPLSTRDDLKRNPVGVPLALVNAVAFLALAAGAAIYAVAELRWSSIVIVAGLALLFSPGLFNAWPTKWRDGAVGLAIMLVATASSIAALQYIGNVYGI